MEKQEKQPLLYFQVSVWVGLNWAKAIRGTSDAAGIRAFLREPWQAPTNGVTVKHKLILHLPSRY